MINKFNPEKTRYLKVVNNLLKLFYHEKKALERPDVTEAQSILIIDPTLIGDTVMLIPFLRIIKNNNEKCRITLACGKWAKAILGKQNLVDEFIFVDTSFLNSIKRLATDRKKLREQVAQINKNEYDYALEPRGDIRYIYFMHFCNAKRKVSYNYTGGECFLSDVITPSDEVKHLVEDKIYFAECIGCKFDKLKDVYPRLGISESELSIRDEFVKENSLEKTFVIGIHPGASLEKKQWDYFADLIEPINTTIENVVFVVFQGPGEEEAVTKVTDMAVSKRARFIVSSTSMEDYMIRISACDVMVCNDSGAGHIAAAYKVPAFVVFGPFYPDMVKPYSDKNVFCFSENIECKPCMSQICDMNKECLRRIKPEEVANSIIEYVELTRK